MDLPSNILYCIQALESASFSTYAVGGCVRDWLLGLTPHDFDLCTAATPEQIQTVFHGHQLLLHGVKHGTVGVVLDGEVVEITTFRTEGTYADNRHPDWVEFVTEVQTDLARRDFTVNAMAWSPRRGLEDPFNGQTDLKNRVLRAVGDPDQRFREDALRILRGIRFAARFDLTIEENTWNAMLRQLPLTDSLARERVCAELTKLLLCADVRHMLAYRPILTHVIPALAPMVGFDQRTAHHAYDLYTHTAHVISNAPQTPALRWAALLHDVGKVTTFTQDENGQGHFYGHAQESARLADTIARELKFSTALREEVLTLIDQHMTDSLPDEKLLRRRISRLGADTFQSLLQLQAADQRSKGVPGAETVDFTVIHAMVQKIVEEDSCLGLQDLAINGRNLLALGYAPGKALGACLEYLLEQVLSDALPNEPTALCAAAQIYLEHYPEEHR